MDETDVGYNMVHILYILPNVVCDYFVGFYNHSNTSNTILQILSCLFTARIND